MSAYLFNLAVLVAASAALWICSLVLRDASIVDRFWGGYFVLVAVAAQLHSLEWTARRMLLLTLVCVWGLRLSAYLTWRNWGGGEDYRYQAMRRYWGERFPLVSLFTVFLLQAVLAWLVSFPVQAGILGGTSPLTWTDGAGAAVVLFGVVFESVGDYQLSRFKGDPANQGAVMDRGLWRYTRHPNYFGDAVVWWGLYLVSVSVPGGVYTLFGPALMTFLLMRVSGVPMLEKKLQRTRPEYAAYAARTSAFVPWPPRRDRTG